MKFLLLTTLLALLPLTTTASPPPEHVWISLGPAAYRLLQEMDPGVRPLALRRVDSVREDAGNRETGTIRVVQVSSAERAALARAVHRGLHHCGGFVAHDSLSAALQSLQSAPPDFIPTRPDYSIDQEALALPMLADMSDTRLGEDIQRLSAFRNRYYNSFYGADAADWLFSQWQTLAAGRGDIHVDKVYRGSDLMPSVVLSIDGGSLADQVLVMGAHLDSINWEAGSTPLAMARAPGADDDGSGVASLSEVLRMIVASDFHPQRSIRLMAYSGEELGLLGSDYIASDYASREIDVVGVLQLDMTDYKGSDADVYLIDDDTDAQQNQFLEQLLAHYLPKLSVAHDVCGYACSDHASWTLHGYAASFPFEASISRAEDNPWIHSAYDTWGNSGAQATNALKFARLSMAWLVELSMEDLDQSTQTVSRLPGPPCRNGVCRRISPATSKRKHKPVFYPHR